MKPIEGQPGLYRLDDGQIVSTRDIRPHESSERVEGINWISPPSDGVYTYKSWYFTCARWPKNPVTVQQVVELWIGQTRVASAVLLSLLTCVEQERTLKVVENILKGFVEITQTLEVRFTEQPVEGAGLRVHFRGFKFVPRQYGEQVGK